MPRVPWFEQGVRSSCEQMYLWQKLIHWELESSETKQAPVTLSPKLTKDVSAELWFHQPRVPHMALLTMA